MRNGHCHFDVGSHILGISNDSQYTISEIEFWVWREKKTHSKTKSSQNMFYILANLKPADDVARYMEGLCTPNPQIP